MQLGESGSWLGRVGTLFSLFFRLLVVAAGVLAAVVIVVTVGGAQIEGVQHHTHHPGVDLHQELRGPPQGGFGGCPERATRITWSASTERTTESVTDKQGGASMMMWSYSLRQRRCGPSSRSSPATPRGSAESDLQVELEDSEAAGRELQRLPLCPSRSELP